MTGQPKRVVVGVSGSLSNLAALHTAADYARSLSATLTAVLAWSPVGGEIAYQNSPCAPMLRIWETAARDRLRLAFDEAFGGAPEGVELQAMVLRAETGRALVSVADQPDDLLVLGSGRHTRLARAFRFGVASYCLRRAACPVLCV